MSEKPAPPRVDWRGADLRNVNMAGVLLEAADLRASDLSGSNFTSANLRYADLRGAKLTGTNFQNANLYGAKMQGVEAHHADFRGANLQLANFGGAYLEGAILPPPSPDNRPPLSPGEIADQSKQSGRPTPYRGHDHGRHRSGRGI
jgi:hypothetical protein